MRYFLFSGIVHLTLVIVGLFVLSDTLDFQQVGDPSVSFTMVGETTYASGSSNSEVNRPITEEVQKKEPKQEKTRKKVEETKVPEEKIIEEKVEVIEEPKEVEEVVEIPQEEVQEPTKIEDITEVVEAPSENLESETSDLAVNTSNEKNPLEDINQSDNTNKSSEILGEGLVHLDDGSIAAKNQGVKGLEYGFLNQPEPSYPDIARRMGVNEDIIIKVRFLIGYDGRVEDIRYYDDITNFGFRSEVEKALSSWRATPITVDGEPVKLYFYKSFKFKKL